MNRTPLIQVVIVGGLPTIRARSSFHSPCFQNFGQSGSIQELYGHYGLDAEAILAAAEGMIGRPVRYRHRVA